MARHPGLVRRGARYYVRVRIPLDLVETIGRTEVWKSLKTADFREAVRKYFPARAALQETLQEARRRAANGKLSVDEALRIVQAWLRETDRKAATADFGLFADDLRDALAETEQDLRGLIEGEDAESVQGALDRALIAAGWPARPHHVGSIATKRVRVADAEPPAELVELARRSLIEMARRRLDRLQGRPGTPVDPLFANGAAVHPVANGHEGAGGLTIGELIAEFSAERAPGLKAKTTLDYGMLFRALRELWGKDKPVRSITRADCRQIRDLFAALPPNAEKRWPKLPLAKAAEQAKANGIAPMHPRTANKHVFRLSTMLKWAAKEQFIAANPALGLRVAAPKSNPRDAKDPLTVEELRRIFDMPLYRGCKDDQNGYNQPGPNVIRRGRFWVPLICTFAGCRMGEACQLTVDDVVEQDGVLLLLIKDDPEAGQSVKTEAGRRRVPIHGELIKIGFLDHVAAMRDRGEARLFPEFDADRFQKWADRLLKQAGVWRLKKASFHSLRHGFRDALRDANVADEIVDALCGWTRGTMRETYGSGPRVAALARAMRRVRYPGLDLSHLYVR